MISFDFAGSMEFTRNVQQGIHLIKMVLKKGRIGPLRRWKEYVEGKAFSK